MARRLSLLVVSTMIIATVAITACGGGGAAPTAAPTTKPAAPAATSAPAAAPTKPAAAPTTAAAAPAGGTAPAAGAAAGDATAGKAVFDQNCNACHPNGQRGTGPQLAGRNLPADRLRNQVRNGGGGMPAFPASKISDQQLTDLVAYVQSLK